MIVFVVLEILKRIAGLESAPISAEELDPWKLCHAHRLPQELLPEVSPTVPVPPLAFTALTIVLPPGPVGLRVWVSGFAKHF